MIPAAIPSSMERYTITLGSNDAEKTRLVREALDWLGARVRILRATAPYITPDSTGRTALDYANIVAEAETPLQEDELDRLCKSYEQAAGRTRESDTVLIDIDIVCHNGTVLRQADYVSPHFRTGLHLLSSSR